MRLTDAEDGRLENRGRTAFYNDRPYTDCPYRRGSAFRVSWMRGYFNVKQERQVT